MKYLIIGLLTLTSCGYSSRDNESVGQVKKIVLNTPLICNEFDHVDISLGVMNKGVGSMSTEDVWMVITPEQKLIFKKAADNGKLVKVTYDVKRLTFCTGDHFVKSVEILE